MSVKKRTAVCENTHQKNISALKKHIRHNLAQAKATITILRTNTNNI
jgi:transcriptional regulator